MNAEPLAYFTCWTGLPEDGVLRSHFAWKFAQCFPVTLERPPGSDTIPIQQDRFAVAVNVPSLRGWMEAGHSSIIRRDLFELIQRAHPALSADPVVFQHCFDVPFPEGHGLKWQQELIWKDELNLVRYCVKRFSCPCPREAYVKLNLRSFFVLKDQCRNTLLVTEPDDPPLPVSTEPTWIDPELLHDRGIVSGQMCWFSPEVWAIVQPHVDQKKLKTGAVNSDGQARWLSWTGP